MHTRLVPILGCESVPEVLTRITSGPEWASRTVTLKFGNRAEAWVMVYPIIGNDSPYFDFAYADLISPDETLAGVIERHIGCAVIDWSVGRLACIQAAQADIVQLAEIITEVARVHFGLDQFDVVASYEEAQRA